MSSFQCSLGLVLTDILERKKEAQPLIGSKSNLVFTWRGAMYLSSWIVVLLQFGHVVTQRRARWRS